MLELHSWILSIFSFRRWLSYVFCSTSGSFFLEVCQLLLSSHQLIVVCLHLIHELLSKASQCILHAGLENTLHVCLDSFEWCWIHLKVRYRFHWLLTLIVEWHWILGSGKILLRLTMGVKCSYRNLNWCLNKVGWNQLAPSPSNQGSGLT